MVYRQFKDGSIVILEDPTGRATGAKLTGGRAWKAITAEIGPFTD